MTFFIQNLQHYIMFEVLEEAWHKLTKALAAAKNLDALITAHNEYLATIVDKVLMGGTEDILLVQLLEVFKVILEFSATQHRLYDQAQVEMQRVAYAREMGKEDAGDHGRKLAEEFNTRVTNTEQSWKRCLLAFLNALREQQPKSSMSAPRARRRKRNVYNLRYLTFRLSSMVPLLN
jgi:hypothetical protein